MRLDIALTAQEVTDKDVSGKTVVAIDVFRATSTILTALHSGCKAVVPIRTPEDAHDVAESYRNRGFQVLTAGERQGLKLPDMDFGNSPLEFSRADLRGRILVLSTSNGTVAIKNSERAEKILIAALLNARAAAEKLANEERDVVFACAGRLGEFSLEDFAAAGAVTHYLCGLLPDLGLPDVLMAAKGFFQSIENGLTDFLQNSRHGRYLKEIGFPEDIPYCCQLNAFEIVPEYREGRIVANL